MFLFGLFAWGSEVRPASDLDLAAAGMPPRRLLEAPSRLSRASGYVVDLALLERLQELLRERILESGVRVYERQAEYAAG